MLHHSHLQTKKKRKKQNRNPLVKTERILLNYTQLFLLWPTALFFNTPCGPDHCVKKWEKKSVSAETNNVTLQWPQSCNSLIYGNINDASKATQYVSLT